MEKRKWKTIEEQRQEIEEKKADGYVYLWDWEPYTDAQIELAIKIGLTDTTEGTVYWPTGDVQKVKLPVEPSMRVDVLQRLFGGVYACHDLSQWDNNIEEGTILSYNEDIIAWYVYNGVHPKENGFKLNNNEHMPELPKLFLEDFLYGTDEAAWFIPTGKAYDDKPDGWRPALGGFWGPVVIWESEE